MKPFHWSWEVTSYEYDSQKCWVPRKQNSRWEHWKCRVALNLRDSVDGFWSSQIWGSIHYYLFIYIYNPQPTGGSTIPNYELPPRRAFISPASTRAWPRGPPRRAASCKAERTCATRAMGWRGSPSRWQLATQSLGRCFNGLVWRKSDEKCYTVINCREIWRVSAG